MLEIKENRTMITSDVFNDILFSEQNLVNYSGKLFFLWIIKMQVIL